MALLQPTRCAYYPRFGCSKGEVDADAWYGRRGSVRAWPFSAAGLEGALMPDLIESMRPLFEPRHVAVIGASRTPGKPGHTVTRNLVRCGFRGRITPINPATVEVEGLACYGSIAELTERVDCAFVSLPADKAIEAVRQWQYTPTLLNGVPVPVIMTVTVNFTLR